MQNSNQNNQNNQMKYQNFLDLHNTPIAEIVNYQNYKKTNLVSDKNFVCDIYILVSNTEIENTNLLLTKTLLSLSEQIENNFRIILVVDNEDFVYDNNDQDQNQIQKIIYIKPKKNNEISWKNISDFIQQESINSVFSIFLNNGDLLTKPALAILAEYTENQNINVIYSDEVNITNGNILNFNFKPNFALDYFLEYPNYIGSSLFFKNDFLRKANNLQSIENFQTNNTSNLISLIFNILNNAEQQTILHIPEVLLKKYLNNNNNNDNNNINYQNLIQNYFDKQEQSCCVNINENQNSNTNFYSLDFQLKNDDENQNSLLWITNAPKELAHCQRLIEQEFLPIFQTSKQQKLADISLCIIVNLNEISAEATDFLTKVADLNLPNLFILIQAENNTYIQAVDNIIRNTDANYILLLDSYLSFNNNANNILSWLAITQRKNIGIVAPKIIDINNKIFGNAMILGCTGFACSFAHGIHNENNENNENNNFNENYNFAIQLQTLQNISSVSPLALMFSRKFYLDNNGFNLALKSNLSAVVDLCLKTTQTQQTQKYRHIWNPKIALLAYQINIENIQQNEHKYLLQNYANIIANDSFYNKNYSREIPFEIKELANISRQHLIPIKQKKTLLAYPGDKTNCGRLRISYPANIAYEQGKINLETSDSMTQELRKKMTAEGNQFVNINQYTVFDLVACNIDAMLVQRMYLTTPTSPYFENLKLASNKFKVIYDIDDVLEMVPKNSPHYGENKLHTLKTTLNMFQYCYKISVASPELANRYSKYHNNIVIIPNRLNENEWKHLAEQKIHENSQKIFDNNKDNKNKKPRVGYSGSASHSVDTYLLESVIKKTAKQIDWIFFGQCPQNIRRYLAEYHDYVPIDNYAEKLASLNLDLAVAPLEYNDFNACKSNLKILEYGILGYPVIATDFGPYKDKEYCCKNFSITRVKNTPKAWLNAILQHINDLENTKKLGLQLQQQVLDFGFIQQHTDLWIKEWFS